MSVIKLICTLTLVSLLESFQRCYNVINIIHIAALTVHVWISCLSRIQTNRGGLKRLSSKCLQAELNQGGGWERLCMERDPFILTGLMWAWLEQLKEPVISIQEAKALNPDNADAQTVLDTLDQVKPIQIWNNITMHCLDNEAPKQCIYF